MVEKAGLSQANYLEIRLRLLDRIILPPVNNMIYHNKINRPTLEPYANGVLADINECLKMTISEIILKSEIFKSLSGIYAVNFSFTWGLDGSGEHRNYDQLSKIDFSTKQIISICFSLKDLIVFHTKGNTIWENKMKGANRPQLVRPLSIFLHKENKYILSEIVPRIESSILEIRKNGLLLNNVSNVIAKCSSALLTMVDGKVISSLMSLEGAYCTMCTNSIYDCHNIHVNKKGFFIDRTIEKIKEKALILSQDNSKDIMKKKMIIKKEKVFVQFH